MTVSNSDACKVGDSTPSKQSSLTHAANDPPAELADRTRSPELEALISYDPDEPETIGGGSDEASEPRVIRFLPLLPHPCQGCVEWGYEDDDDDETSDELEDYIREHVTVFKLNAPSST
ncbi:hypothetical protein VNI00_009854 [Paramarasmius palmivorus]|uniref:Uncharacterized protein n=1 Tax=Paramarasmius palmivorus TaxID=297713 RepID=A0AAW0CPY8_9AGAR